MSNSGHTYSFVTVSGVTRFPPKWPGGLGVTPASAGSAKVGSLVRVKRLIKHLAVDGFVTLLDGAGNSAAGTPYDEQTFWAAATAPATINFGDDGLLLDNGLGAISLGAWTIVFEVVGPA